MNVCAGDNSRKNLVNIFKVYKTLRRYSYLVCYINICSTELYIVFGEKRHIAKHDTKEDFLLFICLNKFCHCTSEEIISISCRC